ncbi:proline-serine-threonine phosphatase-interacting protein 1-like isoform X1 [Rhopilema esculentum]|uniref:proline-serine-threonine phosphatase-interacting protein 1-like isoform X1 n=1 Tax=Rhopilema esculentum TaxID=499914 RepID=UPI0031D30DD2
MVRFAESFWDKDPTGTAGYDTIIKRLKDGKKVCDDLVEFLKQRAKAEDEYGKALMRISQQAGASDEIGTLKDCIEILKKETESIGLSHCELSKRIEDVGKKVATFRDDQKNERTRMDEKMKRVQKEKKNAFESVVRAKGRYEHRCREFDIAHEALESLSNYTPKEEDKHRGKVAKAKSSQENADQQYQSSVLLLKQIHDIWEQEMQVSCDRFQAMEEERIRFLRNELWLYCNVSSQMNVDEDKMYENMRLQLEKCDDSKDIVVFIHSKQTGSEIPSPLKYENYYHPSKRDVAGSDQIKPKFLSLGRNITPKAVSLSTSTTSVPAFVDSEDADEESAYSVVRPEVITQRSSPSIVVASYDYNAQSPKELTLKKGDILQVLQYVDENWGFGKCQRSGETGAFPLRFVQKFVN